MVALFAFLKTIMFLFLFFLRAEKYAKEYAGADRREIVKRRDTKKACWLTYLNFTNVLYHAVCMYRHWSDISFV